MPNRIRRLATPAILALAVLGLSGTALLATAGAASASTTVTGTTSMTNVPDTTSASGPACGTSANGPTWALDQFPGVTLSATELTAPANTWDVTITSDGSYLSFADPTTCQPLQSEGSITGRIQYTVTSATAPSASGLQSDYNGATEFSTLIDDFFGGSPAISGGDIYTYSYQGGNYTQVGTEGGGLTITGDVTYVACTVSLTPVAAQASVLNTAVTPVEVTATSNYPGTLHYFASNLPKGLSIDPSTGKITGTPNRTGTDVVTVGAFIPGYTDGTAHCSGTEQFNWTVSLTAPSPAPSSSSSGSARSSASNFPTGGVQTGGGLPSPQFPWASLGIGLGILGAAGLAGAGIKRRAAMRARG
jgi:hypothetical protein